MPSGIHIHLGPELQRRADLDAVPAAVRTVLPQPLQHQIDTLTALQTHDLVINAFPTGTGKTKAALLWLLEHPRSNTLLIAPVNELVRQHAKDAQEFVAKAGLPHVVVAVDAAYLRQLPQDLGPRPGERFYRLLTNPALLPEMQGYEGDTKPPLLLVTNPDLFYYGIFYLFNTHDRRNIAEQFIAKFHYIIIDEVHYYNAKQFANLLFFVLLSKTFGYFESDISAPRKICLLSATPDTDLNHFLERLGRVGITIKRLNPTPVEAHDPLSTMSLTPLDLSLYPYTQDAARELCSHVETIAALLAQKKDGAVLLNSLYGVNRLARVLAQRLGSQAVSRITGPLSREERQAAPFKPLLLATPTVDIGFNFEGHPKKRQNLDFVFFEAPVEDQFWQRLGRAGRVLGKEEQDHPSQAVAFIPDSVYERLCQRLPVPVMLSRQELKTHMREAAGAEMQRSSFAEYVQSYALLEVTHPLVEMSRLLGKDGVDLLDRTFATIRQIYAPTSKRSFMCLQGEIQRLQGFRRLADDLRKPQVPRNVFTEKALVKALREYLQEECGEVLPEEQIAAYTDQVLGNPRTKASLQAYVARQVAALQPIFGFRDAEVSPQVEAEDPHGLVSSQRQTVLVDLLHLLRFFHWLCKSSGSSKPERLQVILDTLCEQPVTVTWQLGFPGSWSQFRKSYMRKQPTALMGLRLQRSLHKITIPTPSEFVDAIAQQYVPGLVLEQNDLKPWMWGTLARDGLYPEALNVTFTEAELGAPDEKSLRLFMGLDGYRVMARYGWSIQRTTGEWWIV